VNIPAIDVYSGVYTMENIIYREHYLNKITPFVDKPIIKVITGMRRVGKSTILQMLVNRLKTNGVAEENIILLNKELLEFDFIRDYKDLHKYVQKKLSGKTGRSFIFVDEVQEITDWEKAIGSFFAENMADIYITGSNSKLLSSELARRLSGRYVEILILPLTFKEFLLFRGKEKGGHEDEFDLYLKYGGLPVIHFLEFRDTVIFEYLNAVFNTVLLKDVVARHRIRDVATLERIIRFIFDNCGNITNAKRISDYLTSQRMKVTVDTVQNYLRYLQEAYVIHEVKRYDIQGRRHLELFGKYYMDDLGLRHGFAGYSDRYISGILENVVYLELLSRGYDISIGNLRNSEVDFIAEREGERLYIQVCYMLTDPDTLDREFKPLEEIDDNYPKVVLSLDRIRGGGRHGIGRKNLIEFLLEGE